MVIKSQDFEDYLFEIQGHDLKTNQFDRFYFFRLKKNNLSAIKSQ